MEFKFKHSPGILGQLAQNIARTPPSEDDPPLKYVDRSLMVLGRTFDAHNQRMRQEFLDQREFIASQFRGVDKKLEEVEKKLDGRFAEVEKKMDGRFAEVEKKMDGRFAEVEKKMDGRFAEVEKQFQKVDGRFAEVDHRFDKQESDIQDIKAQLENATAITRNGRLRRMHQPINLIKALKPVSDANKFVWTSHPQVPKHMKNIYFLGQQAKGIFEASWEGKIKQQSTYLIRYIHTF
jgi:DNA repair exonuclease SbcCD ATPase subunit